MFKGVRRLDFVSRLSDGVVEQDPPPAGLRGFVRSQDAVSALEYAILIGVLAVALVAAVTPFSATLRAAIVDLFARIPVITAGVGT